MSGLRVPLAACNEARAIYLVGIHRTARTRWSRMTNFAEWARRPMHLPGFNGRSVAELVSSGDMRDMEYVCKMLIAL